MSGTIHQRKYCAVTTLFQATKARLWAKTHSGRSRYSDTDSTNSTNSCGRKESRGSRASLPLPDATAPPAAAAAAVAIFSLLSKYSCKKYALKLCRVSTRVTW